MLQIHFGGREWQVPSPAASISRALPAIDDLREAIDDALSNPLDFASLDQAIVPGDSVALAVDPGLPRLPEIVGGIVQWLVEHGTQPSNVHIVLTAECGQVEPLIERLRSLGLSDVTIEKHDPDDPQRLSYMAANESAEPIYLNRTLVDADVLIPISCSRSTNAIDYLGAFSIFPFFSSRQMLGQLHTYSRLSSEVEREACLAETRQAAWLAGLLVAIQIIPTSHDRVAEILCGTLETLENAIQQRLATIEPASGARSNQADLVIALIDGEDQNWYQLARALHYSLRLCSVGGSIVLCTSLSQPIGRGLRRLRESGREMDQVARKLSRESSDDALAASVILEATRDHHVYLVSEHSRQSIEALGLGVLSDARELTSLLQHHQRSLVIHSAQHP